MTKTMLIVTAVASLTIVNAKAALSPEEQTLFEKNLYMETYEPDQPTGHQIGSIGGKPVLIFNFGIEDVKAARFEGRSMAQFHYGREQAEQFLFAEGWDKYHDRFFTRAYVQEGMEAYNAVRRR